MMKSTGPSTNSPNSVENQHNVNVNLFDFKFYFH